MMQASIFNIQRYSLHDGGGIRTIVFFKGCPCRCPWCCNPESLSIKPQLFYKEILCMNCSKKINGMCETLPENCPTGAKEMIGKMQSIDEVYDIVKRDQVFYDSSNGGVTLSGGEFLMQQEFAIALLKKCKEANIHTAVETTLSIPIKDIEKLVALVDLFLVDFKIMNEQISKDIVHLDVGMMVSNIKKILSLGANVIPRIPLIPKYTATEENLSSIITILTSLNLKEVHLLPFHQLGASKYTAINTEYLCEDLPTLSDEDMASIVTMFQKHGFKTNVHGT